MHFDEDFIRILSLVKRINVAVIGDVFFLRCRGLPNKPLCNAKTLGGLNFKFDFITTFSLAIWVWMSSPNPSNDSASEM